MGVTDLLAAEARGKPGATNVWLTPRYLLEALGPFDLDPCACPGRPIAPKEYFEADNGLYQPWEGLVWCNPPYGVCTGDWVTRWVSHGNGFLLVAARPDTAWWHEAAKAADLVWFPRGRIRFETATGEPAGSPAFASCAFAMGPVATARLRRMAGVHMSHNPSGSDPRPREEKEEK